jgi:ABC-type transport system involved in multi-copper enzyme maturation permease subunit
MTLLPVVARELRVASRRPSSYWGRSLAALVALAVFAWFLGFANHGSGPRVGQALFGVTAGLAYVFAALTGVLFSADSISREKREGTLGLLFLTGLRGVDVALGKLTASSLAAVYGLLAVVPVLAICLLLGGVTGAEYFRVVAVLGCVLLTSLAIGLLASTQAQDPAQAAALAFTLIAVWQFGAPICLGLGEMALKGIGVSDLGEEFKSLIALSPITAMHTAYAVDYQRQPVRFGGALTACGLLGLSLAALASWRLPRIWQVSEGNVRCGLGHRLARMRFPTPESWQRFRLAILALHPVAWLGGRHWLRRWLVWVWLIGAALVYVGLALLSGDDGWWGLPPLVLASLFLHALLKFWAALEAPRQFFADRRSGALELLLTTPVDGPELVRGNRLTLRRQFFWPAVAVVGFDLLVAVRQLIKHPTEGDNDFVMVFAAVRAATLFLDLRAISWLGMWTGLSAQGNLASVFVVLKLLVLPCAVMFVAVPTLAPGSGVDWAFVTLLAWPGLTLANNLLWVLPAKRGLRTRFREVASGQLRGEAKAG